MTKYVELKEGHSKDYAKIKKRYNLVSLYRFLLAAAMIALVYILFRTNEFIYAAPLVIIFFFFAKLMKTHKRLSWEIKIKENLILVNEEEITYLNKKGIPFQNGLEYTDTSHFYSYDLDFFGTNSFFHNINRTATHIGNLKLSKLLLSFLPNDDIKANQIAVKELSEKIKWRQYILALTKISKDSKENYQKLIEWSNKSQEDVPKLLINIGFITPVLFVAMIVVYLITRNPLFSSLATSVFILNLILASTQLKKIKQEIIGSAKILGTIRQYGLVIRKIEEEEFTSVKLNDLKKQLVYNSDLASIQINKISSLFLNMQSIQNGMGAILMNGMALYHVHNLNSLLKWKKEYAPYLKEWLDIIGEFEALNSIANFAYNNPGFVYPELNKDFEISFNELGHPLIEAEQRICNDVEFSNNELVILTGSNMSGKSTFLRTLGLNMVLAGIGSPICATKANIHPLNVLVSMRQADSLNDGESYFFAEVKRLKQIIDQLDSERCFVLLDEILKGTNSDDKQAGTIEVIKKMISKKVIGAIATHDLEVCQTTYDYPNELVNKCFEVEIIDDELSFDYKLRDGICKNKSATFLMKKMEII